MSIFMSDRQLITIDVFIVSYLVIIFAKYVCEFDKIDSFLINNCFIKLIINTICII